MQEMFLECSAVSRVALEMLRAGVPETKLDAFSCNVSSAAAPGCLSHA